MKKERLVYQRKDGKWEARYKKGLSPEGKVLYGAVYGTSKEEVIKRRSEITGNDDGETIKNPTEMNLLILGAGTHGQDVYEMCTKLHIFKNIYFADDNKTGEKILGKCKDVVRFRQKCPCAIIAIGDNTIRKKYAKLLKSCGYLMPNIISGEASLSNNVRLGVGNVILPQARVGDAEIGDCCILASNSLVNSGAKVGSFSHVDCGSMVLKGDKVPEGTTIRSGEIYREEAVRRNAAVTA